MCKCGLIPEKKLNKIQSSGVVVEGRGCWGGCGGTCALFV